MPRTLLLVMLLTVTTTLSAGPAGDDSQTPRDWQAMLDKMLASPP